MESLENKILQHKLSELEHTLPANYRPSLDSKWAMLELALTPEKEPKKRVILPWAAAAVFLLLAGLWWMQKPADSGQLKEQALSQQAPVQKPEEIKKSTAVHTLTDQVKKKAYTTQKSTQKTKTILVAPPAAELIIAEQEKTIRDSVQEPMHPQAARPHKKARMLEIDFNEPVEQVSATVAENTTQQPRLRIGIGSLARVKTKNVEQSSPVKLLSTF